MTEQTSLAKSTNEGCGSKRAVLPVMNIYIFIYLFVVLYAESRHMHKVQRFSVGKTELSGLFPGVNEIKLKVTCKNSCTFDNDLYFNHSHVSRKESCVDE
jgi:hypothetical protein